MNSLIKTIREDDNVRYTKVGDLHFSAQRKDGYILLRGLKIEPYNCSTRPFRTLTLNEVCYWLFSSTEDFFKHLESIFIKDEDWLISDEENIELDSFERLLINLL